jgi:hypothetical protein
MLQWELKDDDDDDDDDDGDGDVIPFNQQKNIG